ncbi:MAG: hypothetical protein R2754_01835 [Microthrixaceae bacterium]
MALPATAGAAPVPRDLADIKVAEVNSGFNLYVVATLSRGGVVSAQPMTCSGATCKKHGWVTLGSGLKSVEIDRTTNGNLVVLGRSGAGKVWYRRAACNKYGSCTWEGWRTLGGNVRSVRSETTYFFDCAWVVGLSPRYRVYRARICESERDTDGWAAAGGSLRQIEVDENGRVFGTSASGRLWWKGRNDTRWTDKGGRLTQPVSYDNFHESKCGLSPGAHELWCLHEFNGWTRHPGYWRKLDDGQAVGIAGTWSFKQYTNLGILHYGGLVNQVATDRFMQVGVSGNREAWYRYNWNSSNRWARL